MTDEQLALEAAVVAAPDDDLPRLVYADWLDEHGDGERAEFIRLQVAAGARRRVRANNRHGFRFSCRCGACKLDRKADRLLPRDATGSVTGQWIHPAVRGWVCGMMFARGFPDRFHVRSAQWDTTHCTVCVGKKGKAVCPECKGTKDRPGAGYRIVAYTTARSVLFLDRMPEHVPSGRHSDGGDRFYWHRPDGHTMTPARSRSCIPGKWFECLSDPEVDPQPEYDWLMEATGAALYATAALANDGLSSAAMLQMRRAIARRVKHGWCPWMSGGPPTPAPDDDPSTVPRR